MHTYSRTKIGVITSLILLTLAFSSYLLLQAPSNDRPWNTDQAILPSTSFSGTSVTIENIRNFSYTSTSTYTPAYYTQTYDAARIVSVDYVLEPFKDIGAHTLLSFGFDDGTYLSISAEIRKETNELFSPWKGLVRNYELMYVIADERDVVKLRSNYRKDTVYVYPLALTRDEMQSLFIAMLERANTLAAHPEFYHTVTNNCTTNIIDHLNDIRSTHISWHYSFIFPEHSDTYLHSLGLIGQNMTLSEARTRYQINERAMQFADDPNFSKHIRENI